MKKIIIGYLLLVIGCSVLFGQGSKRIKYPFDFTPEARANLLAELADSYLLLVAFDDSIAVYLTNIPLDSLAQGGAISGQVLKWNGSAWAPAADATGSGGSAYADSITHDGRHVIGDSLITDVEGDARFQPLESTLTDIADGTISENLINTANPWADNEVADDITASSYLSLTAFGDSATVYILAMDSTWYNITVGSDPGNSNGIIYFVASDGDQGNVAITTGDALVFNGFSAVSLGVAIATSFTSIGDVNAGSVTTASILNSTDMTINTTGTGDDITIDPNSAGVGILYIGVSGDNDTTDIYGVLRLKDHDLDTDYLSQEGATSGQVLKWNGSAWAPAADATGSGGSSYADSVVHDGRHVIGDSLITDAEGDARFQPLESTLTDIADGTISENLVNTAYPWADDEVANDITASNYVLLTAVDDSIATLVADSSLLSDSDIKSLISDSVATHDNFAELGGNASDAQIPNNITINEASDVDTTGTKIAAALASRVNENELSTVVPANETDPNSLLTAGTDNVRDTHIDWGSGAGQISFTDIPGSIAAGQYAAGSIDEDDLNITNSPTDNYILSYNLAGTNFTWVEDQTGSGSFDSSVVWIEIDTLKGNNLTQKITLVDTLELGTGGVLASLGRISGDTLLVDTLNTDYFMIDSISVTSSATELNVLDGIPGTLTATELGYVDGVTSAIQTQINSKEGTLTDKASLESTISDVSDFAEADGDIYTGAHDFGGATSVEVPNGANPTTDAAGEITVDTDDHFIEFYSDASRVIGALQCRTFTILEPDSAQSRTDDIILFHIMADAYPHGITVKDIAISASSAYTSETFLIEEWDTRAGGTQSTIESITISSQYQEDDGTLSDAAIAADAFINVNLDDTPEDVASAEITITYWINAGD